MVGRRSFSLGARGLFSGAFAVSFREGKSLRSSHHHHLQSCHPLRLTFSSPAAVTSKVGDPSTIRQKVIGVVHASTKIIMNFSVGCSELVVVVVAVVVVVVVRDVCWASVDMVLKIIIWTLIF